MLDYGWQKTRDEDSFLESLKLMMLFFEISDKILQVDQVWRDVASNMPLSTVPSGWLLKSTDHRKILRHEILAKVEHFIVLKSIASQMIEDSFWNPCINNEKRSWTGKADWKTTSLPFGRGWGWDVEPGTPWLYHTAGSRIINRKSSWRTPNKETRERRGWGAGIACYVYRQHHGITSVVYNNNWCVEGAHNGMGRAPWKEKCTWALTVSAQRDPWPPVFSKKPAL